MAKRIILSASEGHALKVDFASGTVHVGPKTGESGESGYLVIESKKEASPSSPSGAADSEVEGTVSYPLPPIIMTFRSREAASAAAMRTQINGPLKLSHLAQHLEGLDEDETEVITLGESDA